MNRKIELVLVAGVSMYISSVITQKAIAFGINRMCDESPEVKAAMDQFLALKRQKRSSGL